jgi:spermidine synthase
MNFKSFLRRFFLGAEVLEKIHSSINGEILVVEDLFGKREMRVGEVAQSGGLVKKLWSQLFQVQSSKFKVQSCLILGLGCGTLAKIISTKFPKSRMIGVEIDPLVVELGKKYFGLGEIPNLKIIITDAIKFVDDLRLTIHDSRFDLIVVDLYVGQEFPQEAESDQFLSRLKKILRRDGIVIFNRLYYNPQHQKLANQLVKKLTIVFPQVKTKKLFTNLLVLASF